METEVGVEGNEEGMLEESRFEKSYSSLSSTKQLTDPVVYKLVRVEGDGRLVPATDDEVMEVEGMLNDGKSETHIFSDTRQAMGYIPNEGSPSGLLLELESLQGLSNSGNDEIDQDKLNARLKETVPFMSTSMCERHMLQSENAGECANPPEKLTESGSLISATVTSSGPDFSLLKRDICLDSLSIRELHETFKATFGRETTVKDKQWLKRRITMGLTNSCDVSTTTFTIKDNKLVKTAKEDCACENIAVANDPAIETADRIQEETQISHGSELEVQKAVSVKMNHNLCYNSCSEDNQEEQKVAKRVRKPTRRYIEELSEVEDKESSGRLKNSVKDAGLGQILSNVRVRAIRNVASDGRTYITRLDSIGGSGIQIPRVSRVRRSRPRKNFMALMKFNPSDIGVTATIVKKALDAHTFLSNDENGNNIIEAQSASAQIQPKFLGLADKDKQFVEVGMTGPAHHKMIKLVDSSGDSDDNIVTVPTSKGGTRRKHHRAWTLSEVMKLVEGVSRYGAGRWSEIKRLVFASYSYRTSVDLKDKWRNLLKASFAQIPTEKGINSRKNNATMPIPEPILLRVRELAKMQSLSIPNLSISKVAGSNGNNNVHEKKSGHL